MNDSEHPLRCWRKAQKPPISLQKLADDCGTSKPNLSRIENGKHACRLQLGRKLAAHTGIPLLALIEARKPAVGVAPESTLEPAA